MRSAAVLLSSTRKTGRRSARRESVFPRRAMRGGLQSHRRSTHPGTSIAAARCAYVDRRLARRRYRPDFPPPAPEGFVPAVVH
jgi:hypothetical protein